MRRSFSDLSLDSAWTRASRLSLEQNTYPGMRWVFFGTVLEMKHVGGPTVWHEFPRYEMNSARVLYNGHGSPSGHRPRVGPKRMQCRRCWHVYFGRHGRAQGEERRGEHCLTLKRLRRWTQQKESCAHLPLLDLQLQLQLHPRSPLTSTTFAKPTHRHSITQ